MMTKITSNLQSEDNHVLSFMHFVYVVHYSVSGVWNCGCISSPNQLEVKL